ncbi:MAG: sigma-54 dependent transcriptional regulator [Vicinamibacterales bacterium]
MTGRVAVVDDDRAFTEYLATWLGSRGLAVDVFHSGTSLLERLRAGAAPHVVLLDVAMPDLNGLDTLRAIRQSNPAAQVIMLSGRNAPATVIEAVRRGAADYVLKPDDPDGVGEAALESAINKALEREALASEVARLSALRREDPTGVQPCWGAGPAMQHVMTMVERVADSDVSVLLRGESGVGKEVIARELHRRSPRRAQDYVKVNCAALPADLLESELFGYERGAFTGAGATRIGKFEAAHNGTIVLDEIGEMPPGLQAKLLHVLQDRAFTRLGSNRPIEVDVRVISATNRDLEAMMRAGTFREDLYYRLQVIELRIPPLRERRDEIAPLVEFFMAKYASVYGRPPVRPSATLLHALQQYSWPGNIRELENMMKRLVVLQEEPLILAELDRLGATGAHVVAAPPPAPPADPPPGPPADASTLPPPAVPASPLAVDPPPAPEPGSTLPPAPVPPPTAANAPAAPDVDAGAAGAQPAAEPEPAQPAPVGLHAVAKAAAQKAERQAILEALARFRWNRRKVADHLDVSYKTLLTKMKECGISEPAPGP